MVSMKMTQEMLLTQKVAKIEFLCIKRMLHNTSSVDCKTEPVQRLNNWSEKMYVRTTGLSLLILIF